MMDTDLLQSNYLGRDGFRWWIGQVADPDVSGWGKAREVNAKQQVPDDANSEGEMYLRRCKVRILGYHTISDSSGYVLKDSDLPWAHIMVPAGQGTGVHGVGEFHEYRGGENVMGFFMDGDDAQQPVIIGGFGNQPPNDENKKTNISEITNEKQCEIKPFQPRPSPNKNNEGLKYNQLFKSKYTAPQNVETTNAVTGQPTDEDENTDEVKPPLRENVGSGSRDSDGGHQANKNLEQNVTVTRDTVIASENLIGKVSTILESILVSLKSVQEYNELYLGGTIKSLRSIQRQIDGGLKQIAGAFRAFFESFKGFLIEQIEAALNSALELSPETAKPIIILGVQVGVKEILCVISKILTELNGGIDATISKQFESFMSGRFIDSALCAVEEFITNILDEFLSPIIEQISGALVLLGDILGDVSNFVTDAVSKATSIINKILSFFSCFQGDGFKTSPPASWTFAGPNAEQKNNFNNILASLNIPDLELPDFDSPSSPIVCDAFNGYIFPPTVLFSFGDASAFPVIGNDGIIGIYIDEPGKGYSPLLPPAISIIQPGVWGEGGGAKAKAVVDPDTGGISQVILTKPGRNYSPIPKLVAQSVDAPTLNSEDEIPRDKISNVENVIPFLNDLQVIDPGIGYTPNDTILINNEDIKDLGFDISLEIGPGGSIVEINTNNTNNFPVTFEDRPLVEIVSDTGAGANIVPVMDFILLRDFSEGDAPDQIVTTTDIDGNQISVKSSEIIKVVQCYNQ